MLKKAKLSANGVRNNLNSNRNIIILTPLADDLAFLKHQFSRKQDIICYLILLINES